MNKFATYGYISNPKINFAKSEAMNISLKEDTLLKTCTACPFRWVTKTLKFLGIWLTPDLGSVYEHNFPAILRDLKKDLQTWNSRYFSWFGRAAIIKMVVLPRFLYPLRNLPIKIPQACFKSLRSILLGFLWGGKKPRIKLSLLSRPREKGGDRFTKLPQLLSSFTPY